MAVKLHSSDYFISLMKVFDILYTEMLGYFICHSPKDLVKHHQFVNHDSIKTRCIEKLTQFSPHTLVLFKHSPTEIVNKIYSLMFGENGKLVDDFVYQTKGHGWCKRVFPPSDNEMYAFVVQCVTDETKQQYKQMIVL
jgi:hypothetical protein